MDNEVLQIPYTEYQSVYAINSDLDYPISQNMQVQNLFIILQLWL